MTTNEKITAIENKIRGECEWLMELSFGCEIVVAGIARDNPGCENDVVLYGTKEQWDKGLIPTEYYGQVPKNGIEKIIGHTIQLDSLMYTLDRCGEEISIDCEGYIRQRNNNGEWVLITPTAWKYDLSIPFKENLEQSPELVEFLFNLICK